MRPSFFRSYFQFSKAERTGLLVLLAFIAFSWCLPVVGSFFSPPVATDTTGFAAAVTTFEQQLATALHKSPARTNNHSGDLSALPVSNTPALFYFDPNTLPANDWERLGVPPRTIRTIQNYIRKGGRFHKQEDLQKIYGLSPVVYQRLVSYVRIPDEAKVPAGLKKSGVDSFRTGNRPAFFSSRERPPLPLIAINTADILSWQALPGIGPVLARRIVTFRERLGGFYAIAQVAETYGLPDTTFKKIQALLRLDNGLLRKIDINHTDEKSLADHPYISQKLAGLIVRYRNAHGPFSQLDDLRSIPLVDEIIYRKIEHYIQIKF